MTDLAPMEPCPFGKDGRHRLEHLVGTDESGYIVGDVTSICRQCGTARRIRTVPQGPMDDMSAEDIRRMVEG